MDDTIAVHPYRVAQFIRMLDGIGGTAFYETGDEEALAAYSLAIACIVERTMADSSEQEWKEHREMVTELLAEVEKVEMGLAKSQATQKEAMA